MPLDKGSLMPPHHCWHAEMGEGRLNRKSFLGVQGAAQAPRGCNVTACARMLDERSLQDASFKKKDGLVISNRYDTTFN